MPRLPLLITATLIGMPSIAQVASSWLVIWKQPSPSIAQTTASGRRDLRAHRGGHRVAHRAQAAGVEPGARLLVADELRRPHLVLAHARRVDRVRSGDLPDPLDDVLRRQRPVVRPVVAERVGGAPGVELRPPLRQVGGAVPRARPRRRSSRSTRTSLQSPTIGTSARRFLPISAGSMSACTIFAPGRERRELAGDPVVEAGAERDEQVRLLQRADRGRPCRACRACRRAGGWLSGNAPSAISVVTTGMFGQLGQRQQLRAGLGLEHAAADVEHRAAARR